MNSKETKKVMRDTQIEVHRLLKYSSIEKIADELDEMPCMIYAYSKMNSNTKKNKKWLYSNLHRLNDLVEEYYKKIGQNSAL